MQTVEINPLHLETSVEDPLDLLTLHEVNRPADLAALTDSMLVDGWHGAPLVIHMGTALTGVHRIAAAINAGLTEIPTVEAADLFTAVDVAFDAETSAWDLAPELEALYDALPAEIRDAYGLQS